MEKCNILGVNVNVTTMEETVQDITQNIHNLRGKYICVSNVHTTVMSYENLEYKEIQNNSYLVLPDGKPLSIISKLRGYRQADRVTGPDLMERLFLESNSNNLRHYFYGSTEATLVKLKEILTEKYPEINIVGLYSPPFRKLTKEEDREIVEKINSACPDIIWVGLGAPKQEIWMSEHQNSVIGLMIGVGAGFDYHAKNIRRAPKWMQEYSLEWLYRLLQDPKRLIKRYFETNLKFIFYIIKDYRGGGIE